jgi:FkbM family methyltransferase
MLDSRLCSPHDWSDRVVTSSASSLWREHRSHPPQRDNQFVYKHQHRAREALRKEDGVAEFLLSNDVGWGRLSDRSAPCMSSGSLTVPFRSLTTTIDKSHLPPPDVIKIDIEGGEIGMLEGSRDVLSRCRPILLIELHGTNEPVDAIFREQKYSAYVLGESRPVAQALGMLS